MVTGPYEAVSCSIHPDQQHTHQGRITEVKSCTSLREQQCFQPGSAFLFCSLAPVEYLPAQVHMLPDNLQRLFETLPQKRRAQSCMALQHRLPCSLKHFHIEVTGQQATDLHDIHAGMWCAGGMKQHAGLDRRQGIDVVYIFQFHGGQFFLSSAASLSSSFLSTSALLRSISGRSCSPVRLACSCVVPAPVLICALSCTTAARSATVWC